MAATLPAHVEDRALRTAHAHANTLMNRIEAALDAADAGSLAEIAAISDALAVASRIVADATDRRQVRKALRLWDLAAARLRARRSARTGN